jgi:hypothetical protein
MIAAAITSPGSANAAIMTSEKVMSIARFTYR